MTGQLATLYYDQRGLVPRIGGLLLVDVRIDLFANAFGKRRAIYLLRRHSDRLSAREGPPKTNWRSVMVEREWARGTRPWRGWLCMTSKPFRRNQQAQAGRRFAPQNPRVADH
jgi:hypothetical protein